MPSVSDCFYDFAMQHIFKMVLNYNNFALKTADS